MGQINISNLNNKNSNFSSLSGFQFCGANKVDTLGFQKPVYKLEVEFSIKQVICVLENPKTLLGKTRAWYNSFLTETSSNSKINFVKIWFKT